MDDFKANSPEADAVRATFRPWEPPAPEAEPDSPPPEASDFAIADGIAQAAQGALRWSVGMDWMAHRVTHWEADDALERFTIARNCCLAAAKRIDNPTLRRSIASARTVNAALSLAKAAPGILTRTDEWDANPLHLNTPQGVFDLATGLRATGEGLHTQVTAVAPARMPTPRWSHFLAEIFAGDLATIEFIQRVFGYCATGSVTEQKLLFFYGTGANGKSVLVDVLRHVIGSYAINFPGEGLMAQKGETHPTIFTSLQGKRLAITSELDEGQGWAESRLKQLTGDSTLTARRMRQDFYEFPLTQKHILVANYKPRLKGDDLALARRMVLVPFTQRFDGTGRDTRLMEKLKSEAPGILQWVIDGAVKWSASGLMVSPAIAQASADYLAEFDDVANWVAECCVTDAQSSAKAAELYASFAEWKKTNGEHPPSQKNFSQRLQRKHPKQHTNVGAVFQGLRLKNAGSYSYREASSGY